MPRTTAIKRSFDTPKVPAEIPVSVTAVNKPSLGNILAESMTSGVGFGLGSALVRRMFGPVTTPNNDYTQCLEQNTDTSSQ